MSEIANYYLDPKTNRYQPERRRFARERPSGSDRRSADALRTTSEQYNLIRDALRRSEKLHARLKVRGKRVQHVVFALSILGLVLYFADPRVLDLKVGGASLQLGVRQLTACGPILISYLILHMTRISHSRKKLEIQVHLYDNALRRFGASTPGLLNESYQHSWDECGRAGEQGKAAALTIVKNWIRRHIHHVLYWTEDGYLYLAGGTLYLGTWWGSFSVYSDMIATGKGFAGHVFAMFLIATFIAPIVAIIACKISRREKDRVLEQHMSHL